MQDRYHHNKHTHQVTMDEEVKHASLQVLITQYLSSGFQGQTDITTSYGCCVPYYLIIFSQYPQQLRSYPVCLEER